MATVKLFLISVIGDEYEINCRVPDEYKTWTKENQLMEIAVARTLTDVDDGKVYYTRNLIAVKILEV